MPPLLLEDDEAVAVVVSLRRRPAGLSRAWRRRRSARSPSPSRDFLPPLDPPARRANSTPGPVPRVPPGRPPEVSFLQLSPPRPVTPTSCASPTLPTPL